MLTKIKVIQTAEYKALCALVANAIPILNWRHNGLGLLQAYIQEGPHTEIRVHIWDKKLEKPGIIDSGLLHDHRFDLQSYVLYGSIVQQEKNLEENPNGDWQLHKVVNARKAIVQNRTHDGGLEALPQRYQVFTERAEIFAGYSYTFPKREFHGTFPQNDFAVTLMLKTNQDDEPARILAPYGKPVVHAFHNVLLDRFAFEPVLTRAKYVLEEMFAS